MRLTGRIKVQLAIFTIVAVVGGLIMSFGFLGLPAMLFGIGRYTVTVELPEAAGLYKNSNVTYRGTEVGRVERVGLTDTGVQAVLSLDSRFTIPSDLDVEVHSQSAIGEQYIALAPRSADSAPLKDAQVIPASRASVPPDVNSLLDAADRGLQAIPQEQLETAIDESYTAVGGLGPDLSRFISGASVLALDAQKNLDSILTVIDRSQPILDSQTQTADAVSAWAAHMATITDQLRSRDESVAGFLRNVGPASAKASQLLDRVRPTLPVLLANLVTVGEVALAYQPAIEQLLVLVPAGIAHEQATYVANLNTKQDYKGVYLDFNLNFNLPPPCTTGYLPPQQRRAQALEDYPDRPAGDLYCRVPQDSPFNVRGARNYPCLTVPGKRAPTVRMCEGDEQYVPLNDGYTWKGDPNATLSGQGIPQAAGEASADVPPLGPPAQVATVPYDAATGTYLAPDGRVYTRADLAPATGVQTWQQMLLPPGT